jgi:hypothetical protein
MPTIASDQNKLTASSMTWTCLVSHYHLFKIGPFPCVCSKMYKLHYFSLCCCLPPPCLIPPTHTHTHTHTHNLIKSTHYEAPHYWCFVYILVILCQKIRLGHYVQHSDVTIQELLTSTPNSVSWNINPFQSNFSANRILPSSYLFWAVKGLVDYL